jgi:TRAP-type C4-dicarboxylate transport system permease small subunit
MIASGESSARWWARADRGVAAILRLGSILCLVVLLILVTGQVLIRFFPLFSFTWTDEIVELAFAWMVFLVAACLWRSNEHITIDLIPEALAGSTAGRVLGILLGLLALGFLGVFTWEGWLFTVQAKGYTSAILQLPMPLWYAAMPVSGMVMIGYALRRCVAAMRPAGPREKLTNVP